MPNSRATAAVNPGRRLHTATISTSSIAFRPGICRDRVLAPAPIKPMRTGVDMVHLNRTTMSIMATNRVAARSWSSAFLLLFLQFRHNELLHRFHLGETFSLAHDGAFD